MSKWFARCYDQLTKILWGLIILLLPFTSVPIIGKMLGGITVAIPSGLLVFLFILIWVLPKLWKGIEAPKHSSPILLFVVIAIISIILSYWRTIPGFKDINPIKENMEAIITLLMGVGFYFATMLWLRNGDQEQKLRTTLRLISYSGMLVILMSAAEVILYRGSGYYPNWFIQLHNSLVSGPLFNTRISAFAFEPSWLANQLNQLFLPYWLASTVTRYSAFKRRIWQFQVEDICLAGGLVVLFFTLSRLGYLSFILMVGLLLIRATIWFTKWLEKRIQDKYPAIASKKAKRLLRLGIILLVLLVYLSLLLGAGFALSRLDRRNEDIFNINLRDFDITKYAEQLAFNARLSYWKAGWNIFNDFPIFGAGLGNAGFYFREAMPNAAWKSIEVRELFYRSRILLNIKCLGIRILAETGIIGFAAFLSFLILLLIVVIQLFRSKEPYKKMIAWLGLFTLAAFGIEQLSLDTFALPYFWISMGLVSAVSEKD